MLFDKICKIAEREIPDLVPILRRSRIFHFDKAPHEFLPKEIDPEILDFLRENFMMPFPCVAIEDKAGLVILEDATPNQRGVLVPRKFIDIVRGHTPSHMFGKDASTPGLSDEEIQNFKAAAFDPVIMSLGVLDRIEMNKPTGYYVIGSVVRMLTIALEPPKGATHVMYDWDYEALKILSQTQRDICLNASLTNAMSAIEEIIYANTPHRFILETAPSKSRVRKKPKAAQKILRSPERPVYTILTPGEIRKVMHERNPNGSNGAMAAHERRAHPRTFHSDRYVHMKGKTIMIPAVWVGVSEKVIGARRYRVRLDL